MRLRTSTLPFLVTIVAVVAMAPGAALAADAGVPDEMVDPAAAVEPEVSDGAEEEAAVAPEDGATGAAADATVTMDGSSLAAGSTAGGGPSSEGTGPRQGVAGVAAAPADATVGSGGSLPFTGPEDGRIALLLVIGSLLLAGGATAWSMGRASAELG